MSTRFGNRGGAAPAGGKGRFAGVSPTESRFPQLPFDFSGVVEVIETRNAKVKGDTFIADVKVISSDVDSVAVGENFAWVQAMTDKWNTGAGKVMRFVIALGGMDDAEIQKMMAEAEQGVSVVDAACGVATEYGENPLAGARAHVRVTRGQPDKSGGFWRECAWSPAE